MAGLRIAPESGIFPGGGRLGAGQGGSGGGGGSPSTFTPVFTYAFPGTSDPLSGNGWSKIGGSANFFEGGDSNCYTSDPTASAYFANSAVLANNQYAQIEVTVAGTNANSGLGVTLLGTAGTDTDLYYCIAQGNTITVGKIISTVASVVDTRSATWVDGDTLRFAHFNGNLYVYINTVLQGAAIAKGTGPTSGIAGFAGKSSFTSGQMQDFACGDVT